MITEDYVSFETAKLLKEKGFNEPTLNSYHQFEEGMVDIIQYRFALPNSENSKAEYNCPTHQMAAKWLRVEHKLHIEIVACAYGYNIIISKDVPNGTDVYASAWNYDGPNDGGAWDEYEQAMEAALQYCLTKLI